MRFIELLKANKAYIDELEPSFTIPGFKLLTVRLYIVYFVLWNIIIIPVTMIFHNILASLDYKYKVLAAQTYAEALDKDIPKYEMERFIMDRLVELN